ncbi:MAG: response regulator transcription factor [Saprospiraceae bacterium]|nr:response regulator transcription factor [Saprospiraceae bacterium]
MQSVSVILADAQYLTRFGLRQLLEAKHQFEVLAEADCEDTLLQQLNEYAPQVVILDYNYPGYFSLDTIDLIKAKAPNSRILIISEDHDKNSIYEVLELGVSSFLTKTCGEEEIIDAINATARGQKFFCTKVLDYLLEKSFSKGGNCDPMPLTLREIEIVKLVAKGLIAKEIADELNLSPHTVYTHRKKIMKKLNLSSSSELVLYAVNNGIVERL